MLSPGFFLRRMMRELLSFSTFEPHTDRLTTALAATCFCDNARSDVSADQYQRGHVLNSFSRRCTNWHPRATSYAASSVRLLVEDGWHELDQYMREYDAAKASRTEHLLELHGAREIADALLDPSAVIPECASKLSPLSSAFVASHVLNILGASVDEHCVAQLKESESHFLALVRLLPHFAGQLGGEQTRRELLDRLPEHLLCSVDEPGHPRGRQSPGESGCSCAVKGDSLKDCRIFGPTWRRGQPLTAHRARTALQCHCFGR